MKKITFLLLAILPMLVFGQITIESYTFDTDAEGFVPGNAADTAVTWDELTNYHDLAGAIQMDQLTANKVIKVVGISTMTTLGDYTLKFKIKGVETGANIKGNLRTTTNYAGEALMMSSLPSSTGGDGDTWYEYSTTITIATINATNSQIQIQTNTLGTYFIDDVELIQEPLGGTVLTVNTVGAGSVALLLDKISYADTDVETLTANPATHWNFDSWSGDLTGSTNPETLLMDTDKTVTATFTVDPGFDYGFTFDTDGELEGWITDPQLAIASHTGGQVALTPTTDQWARFSLFDFPIPATFTDPSKYNKLTITLKNESTNDDELGIIVNNGTDNTVLTYPMSVSDSGFQTYDIDMTYYLAWSGDVTTLRIRFADADNPTAGKSSGTGNVIIDSIVFTFDATLNTTDVLLNEFAMYPNPANNVLNINSKTAIKKVEIYNIMGKQVLTTSGFVNRTEINISSLNSGVYLVKISDQNDNSAIKKLILK